MDTQERIGKGGSQSNIFLVNWNDKLCAYKKFHVSPSAFQDIELFVEFEKEVEIFSSINHPNILQFYGACVNPPEIGILLEYCSNGDLYSYLAKQKIEIEKKIGILNEIAQGMKFLHSRRIIHRDLKPENVLVNRNEESKIMDFGLSKIRSSEDKTMTKTIGTSFYMAPEVIVGGKYSFSCDVYSFAFLAFTFLTEDLSPFGRQPFILKKALNPNYRPKINSKKYIENWKGKNRYLKDLIVKNWSHDPKKRNNFDEICSIFKKNKK